MLLLVLLACKDPGAQPRALVETVGAPTNVAAIWNGFRQVWGYNHRINSLGDYVRPAVCDAGGCLAEVVHAAASGSGSDLAAWTSQYTAVHAPGTVFVGGTARIAVDLPDAEGELIQFSTDVTVPDMATLAGVGEVHTLLNGFDLLATDDADKLAHLTLVVGEAEVDGDTVRFPVDVALLVDCDSVECDGTFQTDASVHYELLVSWLLVAGGDGLAVSAGSVETGYAWGNAGLPDELQLGDLVVSGGIDGEYGFPTAAVGFTGLSVDLDDDHHMAEWASTVSPVSYDPVGGRLPYDANLAFKQWNAGTWWNPVSYTSPGAAAIRADLVMLQFEDACVTTGSVAGTIQWAATGGPASDAAVAEEEVALTGCG